MRITLKQLSVFVAIARHGTMTRAADVLFMTKGAVSQALAELENQLDVCVFDRQRARLHLNHEGEKLLPLAVDQVEYFCIADGVTKAVLSGSESYVLPYTLDELTESLDPERFFRVNRQYLISRHSVEDIDLWFNNRLAINLRIPTAGKILVSKQRVNEFKSWFSGDREFA